MPQSRQRAVYDPPKIRLEQLPKVLHRNLIELPVDTDTRIVDPCIETTELLLGHGADTLHVTFVANVCLDMHGLSSVLTDLFL
jgi:hypothetical protein